MPRPPTLALAALLVLPTLLLVPPALAAVEDSERTIAFTSPDTATAWFNGTLRGDEARQIRIFADDDSDGNITAAESQNLTLRMLIAGNEHKAWPATTLDGAAPVNVSLVDVELDNAIGPTDATTPLQVNRVLQFQYAPDTRADEHTWALRLDESGRLSEWTIRAPPGFTVTDAQGLGEPQTGDDAAQVSGTAEASALRVVFQAANATRGQARNGTTTDTNTTDQADGNTTAGDGTAGDNVTADTETPPPQDAQPEEATDDRTIPAPGILGAMATLGAVAAALRLRTRARR